MDNVEKLRRINELSRELRKHGLVSTSDEAVNQAQNIINKGDSSIKDMQGAELKAESQEYLIKKIVREHVLRELSTNNEPIINEINALRSQIDSLKMEISSIRSLKREMPEERKEVQTTIEPKREQPHPKAGSYKPEEVSVNKIFYFGQR